MTKALIGFVAGVTLGGLCPITIPAACNKLFSVVLLVAFDSVFGGLRAAFHARFNDAVFISGFITNATFATFLVFLGDRLALDLYYVVLLVFGLRIFKNLAGLRRHLLKLL